MAITGALEPNMSTDLSQSAQPGIIPSNTEIPLTPPTIAMPNITPLYVSDLKPEVNESTLFAIFNQFGKVHSIRVCRDTITRASLGYAYVNFESEAEALNVIKEANYTEILGKPCRIARSERDPKVRKEGQGNLFVKNLHPEVDQPTLHAHFAQCGEILSCKIAVDKDGISKGHGFVQFKDPQHSDHAVEKLDKQPIMGKSITVCRHVSSKDRKASNPEPHSNFTNIIVKSLPLECTKEQLEALAGDPQTIASAAVQPEDKGNGTKNGFVNFTTHEAAAAAIAQLHGMEYMGRRLYAARFLSRNQLQEEWSKNMAMGKQGVTVYFRHLPPDFTEAKLEKLLESSGSILSCKVNVDGSGVCEGVGFATFHSPEEALKAVQDVHGKLVGDKPLLAALHRTKQDRQQEKAAQQHYYRNQQLAAAAGISGGPYPMPVQGAPYGYPAGFQQGRNVVYPPQNVPAMPPRPRYPAAGQMPPMAYAQPGQAYPGAYPGAPAVAVNATAMRGPPSGGVNGRLNSMPMPVGGVVQQSPLLTRPGQYSAGPMTMEPAPDLHATDEIDPALLAQLPPNLQKQTLGEALYPLIQQLQPGDAGKITGMILEIDNGELLRLLKDSDALKAKVNEAVAVLAAHLAETAAKANAKS